MKIVRLRCELLQSVYLLQNILKDGWSFDQLAAELKNPAAIGLCAVIDDKVIGYLSCHTVCDEANINNIVVAEEHRRIGGAKLLVTNLVNELLQKNIKKIYLEVRSQNTAAISLYENMGFVKNGFRKCFYSNPSDDALLYIKEIGVE